MSPRPKDNLLRLHQDERGTISIVAVFAVLLLTMLLGMVMNVGRQVDGKIRMQNAADAATYSGGAVLARGMNALAFSNHLLCDVFALTAFMREARDRNSEKYVPGILAAWATAGPVLGGSGFPKFEALGPAIGQKVPLEQEMVRSYSEWAAAASGQILPLLEEILADELIPEYQRAVVEAFPDIAQEATMQVARRNGIPQHGRGPMLGVLWRTSGVPVGGAYELFDRTLPVVDPVMDILIDQDRYIATARGQRKQLSQRYLNDWNREAMYIFDREGKMGQFGALWRSFTCGYLNNLLEVEYPDSNLLHVIRLAVNRRPDVPDSFSTSDGQLWTGADTTVHLQENFTLLGVVYWGKSPERAPGIFHNPLGSDLVTYAEVRFFVPRRRLVWHLPSGKPRHPIGGVPGEFRDLPTPDEDEPEPGGEDERRWVVIRQRVPVHWDLLNQHWTCQLVPATQPVLATVLQTQPPLPAFADGDVALPNLGGLTTEDIGRISPH